MPYADFRDLQAFYEIEPFGLHVQDAMNAHRISYAVNLERDREQRPEPYLLKDFLLFPPFVEPVPEALVDGKTGTQWKLIFAAEAMRATYAAGRST